MDILLTGAYGFLGSIIKTVLAQHKITTLGRNALNDISIDISKGVFELPAFDLVIHAAGKAHSVPKNEQENQEFFDINQNGTDHLLQSLLHQPPKAFVLISTIAVYGREEGELIDETHPLVAEDAYGRSKIKAEELVTAWCKLHEVTCTILRLPLVAGPNPPGNLGSMINGIRKGYYFSISGSQAKKSVVLASDVAAIIPKASMIGGTFNVTDGYHPTFKELSNLIARQLNKKQPKSLPLFVVRFMATVGDVLGSRSPLNTRKLGKITSSLTFDDRKARALLDWNSHSVIEKLIIH